MKFLQKLLCLSLLVNATAYASWGDSWINIDQLKNWNMDDRVVYIKGKIVENYGRDGFLLSDHTGQIRVHLTNDTLKHFEFEPGMQVEVRGLAVRHHWHWDHGYRHWDLEASAVKLHDDLIIGHL